MRRREFMALIGGVAWPIRVSGQQIAMPVIGFLGSATSQGYVTVIRRIWEGLNQEGYTEGRNAVAEYRWADGQLDRLPDLAADLVRRKVAAIVTTGGPLPARAALYATSAIPIVFATGSDPVEDGLVPKLTGSGANITGVTFFSNELAPKRLEIMSELLPNARVFAMLMNSRNPNLDRDTKQIQAAAAARGVTMFIVNAAGEGTPETAFAELAKKQVHAVLVHNDSVLHSRVRQIIAQAAQYSIPTIYYVDECPKLGGLISYGTNTSDVIRQAGIYVARILKGEKAGDLPVQAPTKFELVVNLKTAKALGLTVPPTLLARAEEVIE
jgi:putative tryptophan/tyrosine transport system substrate-binding protein